MPDDILLDRTDGIATVTFNRPDQRNAIDYHGWLELRRIAIDLDRDDSVRVVVFTGAGDRAFSAGADIKDFESYRDNSEKAQVYAEAFDGAMDAIEAISKPTCASSRDSAWVGAARCPWPVTFASPPTTPASAYQSPG